MKKFMRTAVLGLGLVFSTSVLASAPVAHYKGEPSESLAQAVAHFSEYNQKLKTLLDKDLTPESMGQIHQLTYTLENALAKIKEEVCLMADDLEAVHVASETMDTRAAQTKAKSYLEAAGTLIK